MKLDNEGIVKLLNLIKVYGLPLMKAGVEATGNPYDDIAYAMIEAGVEKAIEVLGKGE